ncbi:MAG: DUF2232 domain-containing protein [Lachnospiraceae bacterium]|nr:DUF2232 domain-containing protein [Lachnospiraceae bacterium]
MRSNTSELTFGAMIVAIFSVMLLLNRQSGQLFEEFIFFVLPLPMTVFSLKYGWKDSLPVLACMAFASFFMGTLYTMFFAISEALVGMVQGTCLRKKVNVNKIQFLVIALSVFTSVFGSIVLASLFGINLGAELASMQEAFVDAFTKVGQDAAMIRETFSLRSILRLYILSMILYGVMQGFVIFRLSLVILKRLRFHVPALQPLGLYYPPVWTGYLGLFLVFLYMTSYSRPFGSEQVQDIVQTIGLCGYFFLLIFGWIATAFLIRRLLPGSKILSSILSFLGMLMLPVVGIVLGFGYISTGLHDWLLGKTSV